jgi:SAM-dependent methyltransferase
VQLTHTIPPEAMFSDYLYFSSYADAVADNAALIVKRVLAERHLGPDSLAVEVASNDGYLLRHYVEAGVPVLGIDPARSIAEVAEQRGVPTLVAFFGQEVADRLRGDGVRADVLHANNVMAHVPDINGFVGGISRLLADDGVAVLESPYLGDLIEQLEFDTIYHEHVFYYSLSALEALLGRHGLEVHDLERIPIHGGTLRLFAGHVGSQPISAAVEALRASERASGMATIDHYRDFTGRVDALTHRLRDLLSSLKADGARIAAYGAAAKGATLLNFTGIGTETIDFVVDRNPHKQGRFMPGVRIPVSPPERLLEERPDHLLLLAWNFAEEIARQQTEYRAAGGRLIVPVPEPRIL